MDKPNVNDPNIPVIGNKQVKIDSRVMNILQGATGLEDPSQIVARALQLYADCLVFEAGGFLLTVVPVKEQEGKLVPDTTSGRKTFIYPLSEKYLALFPKQEIKHKEEQTELKTEDQPKTDKQ